MDNDAIRRLLATANAPWVGSMVEVDTSTTGIPNTRDTRALVDMRGKGRGNGNLPCGESYRYL
jgi:hypothetical protein